MIRALLCPKMLELYSPCVVVVNCVHYLWFFTLRVTLPDFWFAADS